MEIKKEGRLVGIKFYRGEDIPKSIREGENIKETDVVKKEIREINPRVSSLHSTMGFLTEFREVFKNKIRSE